MILISDNQLDVIHLIVNKWGQHQSITRACEELNELSVDLLKLLRKNSFADYDKQIDKIKDEMADVRIALEHLEIKFGNYQKEFDMKIERLKVRGD